MRSSSRSQGRLAAALTIVALALTAAGPALAETRIAIVDVQRAVMATEDGIRAQATMKKRFDKRQQELDAKQAELAKVHDEIERQARVISREAVQRRIEDWQQQMLKLQTVYVEYQKELQKMQGELIGPVIKKMTGVIARLAKKNGYELILDKQAAPYVRQDLDLTDQVIQLYNAGGEGDAEEKKPEGNK
jgi:outer membrane protein